jgi:hypothetical protein
MAYNQPYQMNRLIQGAAVELFTDIMTAEIVVSGFKPEPMTMRRNTPMNDRKGRIEAKKMDSMSI